MRYIPIKFKKVVVGCLLFSLLFIDDRDFSSTNIVLVMIRPLSASAAAAIKISLKKPCRDGGAGERRSDTQSWPSPPLSLDKILNKNVRLVLMMVKHVYITALLDVKLNLTSNNAATQAVLSTENISLWKMFLFVERNGDNDETPNWSLCGK